jgi:MYXO-CTERM domain-containing protein
MTTLGVVALPPQTAEACGGTFCDTGPAPMPVDQSGENILFVRDGAFTEAHIQIQYQGDAQNFAWVIPLQQVPEFSVGSEPLFQNLLAGTVPTYLVQTVRDDCDLDNGAVSGFPGDGAGGTSGADDGGDPGQPPGGPQVVLQETVGAYEIAVLQGGTAAEVIQWLDDNGYAQDDEAEPILAAYLQEGFLFGAVKLTGGADVDEIHPIVLRMATDEACIPLRLTRIAAVEDMDVRSFFLGSARTVPQNYRHVLINQVKIDWTPTSLASNYKEIITQAVDAETAAGRAFVTEYAGPSSAVPRGGVYSPAWSSQAFEAIDPTLVIDELTNQGLYFCDFDFGNGCAPTHPLVQPILDQYLPVPAGVEPSLFYDCLSCYQDQIDLMAWDGAGFAAALQQRVIAPGAHANSILDANPYLSRLYTTISPGEMTEDPLFHENPELPEVGNNLTGTQRILCNSDSVYILPDGREVYLPAGAPWPNFDSEPAWSMPSDEEVQEVMAAGAPLVLANNTQAIDDALAAYNAAQGWAGGGATGGGGDDSGSGAGGCGCRTGGGGTAGFSLLLLGLGLGLASRRRPQA